VRFEIIYLFTTLGLPFELLDEWSLADINAYADYAQAKNPKKGSGSGKSGPTYTDKNLDKMFNRGGVL